MVWRAELVSSKSELTERVAGRPLPLVNVIWNIIVIAECLLSLSFLFRGELEASRVFYERVTLETSDILLKVN